MPLKDSPSYFISAGEFSGELLAYDLVSELSVALPKHRAFGIGGAKLAQAGVKIVSDLESLQVMGILDVAKKLADLRMVESTVLQAIDTLQPQFAVLVDYPGFHFRLAEQLKLRGINVIQYVAPKLWAWGSGRLVKLRRDFDLVMGVLPFEEEFFRKHAIPYTFVGSPHRERLQKIVVTKAVLGFDASAPMVACLPGSRMSELVRIAPVLRRIARRMSAARQNLSFAVPVAASLAMQSVLDAFEAGVADRGESRIRCIIDGCAYTFFRGMSLEVMAASDAAIVTSGTATLECGLLRTPMVVVYVMDDFSYEIAKNALKVRHVSLVNLIAGREVVPEFIQEFSPEYVAQVALELVDTTSRRAAQLKGFDDITALLPLDAAKNAAAAVANVLKR